MNLQVNFSTPNPTEQVKPKKKKSTAEILSYVAVALPATYAAFAIIELLITFFSYVPMIEYIIMPVDFLVSPFIDLGQLILVFASPVMGVIALVSNISNKKRVMSQDAPDETEIATAKRGVLLSAVATGVSIAILIFEIIKAIVSFILSVLTMILILILLAIIILGPYILSTLLYFLPYLFM